MKYQIYKGSIPLSALRNLPKRPFDFLVAVIYESDFSIRHALRIPYEVVVEQSTFQAIPIRIYSLFDPRS